MLRRLCPAIPLLALLLPGAQLPAQAAPLAPALAAGADSVFAPFTAPGSPGCALGIVQRGGLVYSRGYGLARIELPAAPRPVAAGRVARPGGLPPRGVRAPPRPGRAVPPPPGGGGGPPSSMRAR